MPIALHIERLIVEGMAMSPAERRVFSESLRAELTQLLANGLAPQLRQGIATPSLNAPQVSITNPFDARRAGESIAQAIYGGIGQHARG